jgi:hypothetical protein
MQQTLLALCAVLVFSLYALSRHRADAQTERDAMAGEIELVTAEQARALLARVTTLEYDEATVGLAEVPTSPETFSAQLRADAGEEAVAQYDDVDDWNGYATTLTVPWQSGGATVPLTATVTVRYVRYATSSGRRGIRSAGAPTMAKEITVTVREANPVPGHRPVVAALQQVVTPAWCARH